MPTITKRTADKAKAKPPTEGASIVAASKMKPNDVIVFTTQTTRARQKTAAARLLKNIPPVVQPGQKPAHELLADYRAGK